MAKVALVVDNPYRDLSGLVLVAMQLCKLGARCFLVPANLLHECWFLVPDFVLLNYLRVNNQDGARQFLDAGIQVGVLDTEGVLASFQDYCQLLAPDVDVRRRIACYCSWGTRLAANVKQVGCYRENQIAVTGAPRFDFYASLWRKAALRASPYAGAYPRPLILINSNFPLSNPAFQTPAQEAETTSTILGYDCDTVTGWQTTEAQAVRGMVCLANRLAARFPRATFIYRPHPFERGDTYHDLIDKRDNLHLVKKGSVDGWILRASAVIQLRCTTAIEAGLGGVPALLPQWLPSPLPLSAAEDVSFVCETEEDVVQTLTSIFEGGFHCSAALRGRLDKVTTDYFYQIDGRSHERVADRIVRDLPTGGGGQRWRRCRDLVYGLNGNPTSWKRKACAALKSALGLSPQWSPWGRIGEEQEQPWRNRADKFYDARTVSRLVDAITTCLPEGPAGSFGRVGVSASRDEGDYHFGYGTGQSVTLFRQGKSPWKN